MYERIHVYFNGDFSLVTNTWAVEKRVFQQFLREKLAAIYNPDWRYGTQISVASCALITAVRCLPWQGQRTRSFGSEY